MSQESPTTTLDIPVESAGTKVTLTATRRDADMLRRLINVGPRDGFVTGDTLQLLLRIEETIREQTPAAEWTRSSYSGWNPDAVLTELLRVRKQLTDAQVTIRAFTEGHCAGSGPCDG